MEPHDLSFAEIGEVFNDATTRLLGGVSNSNRAAILRDIGTVQSSLEKLIANDPATFQGTAGIHAQNIVDQLNLERQAIASIGEDPFAAKYINDVQRDLIDIVQGDDQLRALATADGHNGFAVVPDLLVSPAQFQGNQEQTDFMRNFVVTAADFCERGVALAEQNNDTAAIQHLVGEIQNYAEVANAFTVAQGGVYSARFNNEFAAEGVHGTASRAMIEGLQTGNVDLVRAAADVMANNAADVAGNMLGIGDDPPQSSGNGISDTIDSLALAGTIFNDATTKLIGGVYNGNQASIHDDLTAVRDAISQLVAKDQFSGRSEKDAANVADLLTRELALVDSNDQGTATVNQINKLHTQIIGVVQGDPMLAAAANEGGANGFMQLPGTLGGGDHGTGGHGFGRGAAVAVNTGAHGDDGMGHTNSLEHIFGHHSDHFHG